MLKALAFSPFSNAASRSVRSSNGSVAKAAACRSRRQRVERGDCLSVRLAVALELPGELNVDVVHHAGVLRTGVGILGDQTLAPGFERSGLIGAEGPPRCLLAARASDRSGGRRGGDKFAAIQTVFSCKGESYRLRALEAIVRAPAGVRHRSGTAGQRRGAGWHPARRLPTAAVSRQRASWPIANRPQLAKLPHDSALCLACPYARLPATLPGNRAGVHFYVAHPVPAVAVRPAPLRWEVQEEWRFRRDFAAWGAPRNRAAISSPGSLAPRGFASAPSASPRSGFSR